MIENHRIDTKMKKRFLTKMKETLLSQKQSLLEKQTDMHVDVDGDETDEIQGNMLLEISNQLNSRDLSKLSQIEDALRKIADNHYGICEDCGEDIPEGRLLINPYFLTCVFCAEGRERKRV